MVQRHAFGCLLVCVVSIVLQACATGLPREDLLESKLAAMPVSAAAKRRNLDRFLSANGGGAVSDFGGISKSGNDQLTGPPISYARLIEDDGAEDITLNLLNVPVVSAAKSILSEILELNYSIDGRVAGTVTLQTSQPISKSRLLALFESVLRDNGAAIVADGGTYRIVPVAEAARALTPVKTALAETGKPGVGSHVVPLRFVSAENMSEVLGPMIPQGVLINTDTRRNALILSGTAHEIATIRETISVFDVDWMRGMSFALVPLKSSSPDSVVSDLEAIFETKKGPLKGILRFAPNKRLKSVLVVTSRAKYLKEAANWIRKIDVLAESSQENLHVYNVQNRTASDLAGVLQSILQSSRSGSASAESRVAPKLTPVVIESQADETQGEPDAGPETPAGGIDETTPEQPSGGDPPPGAGGLRARVVSDDSNNSLLIFSTDAEYQRILEVLGEIDAMPNQVLLEAVIAEVSLDDDLKFGVRWFLGDGDHGGTFTDAANGAVSSVFPGFSYFLKANDIAFALNALSSVTNVQVLSSPSLVVLDNKTATLQVGDQVPIVTQSSKGTASGDAPIINNVELKDTGVILNVTPRVNDSGLVILEIEQEVSSVVKTTTSGIDSPTIRQRRVKTSVVVNDGEALALGGLMQEQETTAKTKVPVLGDIPILGTAFRQKSVAASRTELIIFIRPRVIRDMAEARRVTLEFRKQLSIMAPHVRTADPSPGDEVIRIIK